MKRKVSICTLCGQSARGAADYLEQKLREYDPNLSASDCSDITEFAEAVSNCAESGGIVIAAAPVSSFLNAKLRILKIFSSKIIRNNSIINAMGENAPESPKEKDLHAAVPEKSKAFVCSGGLYSAFVKEMGQGIVVFMPLDNSKADEIFASGFGELLEKAFPKEKRTQKFSLAQVKESVQTVIDSKKTVAVSPCGSAKAILSVLAAVPDSDDAFVADANEIETDDGETLEQYIAESARYSKEKAETDLGIGISNVCADEEGDEYVVVCVANSERAKVAKVFAIPDEDKKQLIAAAVVNLCQMVGDLSGAGLVNPAAEIKQKKNKKTPLIISIVAVAIAIIVCFVLAIISGTKDTESSVANAGMGVTKNDIYNTDEYIPYEDIGGVGLDDFETEESLSETQTSIPETSEILHNNIISTTKPKITQIITTIAHVVTTKVTATKATTTATSTTTTTKATTTSTTVKATASTAAPTTEKSTTATQTTPVNGKFVFKVYGYGHGVGLSQSGAIAMANSGSDYVAILTHYFPGTTVKTDEATPATIKYGGKDVPIVEYICKTTKKEMGYSTAPDEALKAQMVAIYTYAKHDKFDIKTKQHAYDESFAYEGTNIHKVCLEILGMSADTDTPKAPYVDYNGSAAFTCYFSTAAGQTTAAQSVWDGATDYPYLKGGVSSPEDPKAHTYEISADEMKRLILAYDDSIVLSDNPAEWLEVISHDGNINEGCGYISSIRVGDKKMKGNKFRASVMDYKIKSHCFTVEYVK